MRGRASVPVSRAQDDRFAARATVSRRGVLAASRLAPWSEQKCARTLSWLLSLRTTSRLGDRGADTAARRGSQQRARATVSRRGVLAASLLATWSEQKCARTLSWLLSLRTTSRLGDRGADTAARRDDWWSSNSGAS